MTTPGGDEAKRKIMKTMAEIGERWPAAYKNLRNVEFVKAVGTDPATLAHVWTAQKDTRDPVLRRHYKKGDMILRFKRNDNEDYSDSDSINAGWMLPNTDSVEGTMYHELAHVLTGWSQEDVLDKLSGWLGEYYKDHPDIGVRPEEDDKALIEAMKKEASGYSFIYKSNGSVFMLNDHEFTSDAFADVMINGDKAAKLSKFVYEKMIEVFDAHAK